MKLIFLHGAPGVGKLSVARELARSTGFRLFHNHLTVDLVSSVFPFGSEPFVLLREQVWRSVFHEAAKHDISLIFTFSPEGTVRERFIEDALEIVEGCGGSLYFVELTCAENELEQRIESPSRKEFGKLSSFQQYQKLKEAGAFNYRKMPDSFSLETTRLSPADAADLIRDYLGLELAPDKREN